MNTYKVGYCVSNCYRDRIIAKDEREIPDTLLEYLKEGNSGIKPGVIRIIEIDIV